MQRRNLQRRDLPVHLCAAYVKEHHAFELKDMDSLKDNEVYISDSFADKYSIKPGDTIKLDAQYEKKHTNSR